MKTRYNSLSLGTKISVLFTLLVFIIILVISVALYSYFENTVKGLLSESVNSTITANNKQMEDLLQRIENAEGLLYADERLYYELGEKPLPICKMIVSYTGTRQELIALREEYTTNLNNFHSYFNTCFGESQAAYHSVLFVDTAWPVNKVMPKWDSYTAGNGFSSSRDVADSEWYKMAENVTTDRYWFTDENEPDCLYMAKSLKYRFLSADGTLSERRLGVLLLGFDASMFINNISMTELTEGAETYLLDESGKAVFTVNDKNNRYKLAAELAGLKENSTEETVLEGRSCFVNISSLSLGLRQLTIVPLDNIADSTASSLRIIFITGIAVLAAGLIAIRLLSISLMSPLKRLTIHMNRSKNEIISIENAGSREVNLLYNAYNHMITELNDSVKTIIDTTEKKNQAELHALQAQINPHFVYNTLNSVSCLAMLHGCEDISDILGNLTMLMRYNVHLPDKLVPLSDELYMIKQYESIQKCCYQECLKFEYDIADEALGIMIPKLIIQPLIENAIIHGADFKSNNAVIRLTVTLKKQELIISVWDNGMEADTDRINRYLSGETDIPEKRSGLGIKNVLQRLGKVFGDNAGLVYSKDDEGCTMAVITIELSNEEADKKGNVE